MSKLFFTQEIEAEDLGFLYGFSLFETFLVNEQGRIFLLEEHIARILNSSNHFNFNLGLTVEDLSSRLLKYLTEYQVANEIIRLSITAGYQGKSIPSSIAISRRNNPYSKSDLNKGFKLTIAKQLKNAASPIIRHKTANYLENFLLAQAATREGFNDVFFLNQQQQLTETTKANIFFVSEGILCTPDVECGLLPGVIRSWVVKAGASMGIEVKQGQFNLETLMESAEVFLTNSVMGIMPVNSIEGKTIGDKTPKPFTNLLLESYQKAFSSK